MDPKSTALPLGHARMIEVSAPTLLAAREHHEVYHTARHLSDGSAREESLGEGGDEDDFEQQAEERLTRGEDCHLIPW